MESLKARLFYDLVLERHVLSAPLLGYGFHLEQLCFRQRQAPALLHAPLVEDNLWLSRARVEIEGLENIDHSHPQIFVCNHSGLHDILSLACKPPHSISLDCKEISFQSSFHGMAYAPLRLHPHRSG